MADIDKIGDTVRIYGTLLVNETPTDPNTLRLDIIDPDNTTTSYIYGTDAEVVRDSAGQFHFDLFLTKPGDWTYRWFSNSNLTAFEEGTIEVATAVQVESVNEIADPVAFVTVRLTDGDGKPIELEDARTNGAGILATALPEGSYRVVGFKLGWIFPPISVDVTGTTLFTITLAGRLMSTSWLQWEDLEQVVDKATIDRLFQDDNSAFRDTVLVEQVIQSAEALAESKLLRSWTREQIATVAGEDAALRAQAAWIAIEMASERRQEFIAVDGKGRFWAQYERAVAYFDALSKSKDHSRGESKAVSANTGGERNPRIEEPQQTDFIFAPDRNGFGSGGF